MANRPGGLPADLKRLAVTGHGNVTLEQALASGLTQGEVRVRLEQGDFERRYRGVFRLPGARSTWEADVAAALRSVGPLAVVSHASAARLLGLGHVRPAGRIELTVPYGHNARIAGVRMHRTREPDRVDVRYAEGFPVTTAARTLVDVAGRHTRSQLIALVDDALCARLVRRVALHARATALRSGRRGVGAIVAVTAPGAEDEFWSWLERQASRVLTAGGIRGVERNVSVEDGGRVVAVLDALVPEARLPLEFDGLRAHGPPRHRRRDAGRSNLLHRLDLHPLRYTWQDVVEEPERMVAQVRAALVARGCAHLTS